ncbi:MAG: hypothetical protein H7067_06730, partial [Burkholderiales bacterium]|nr:hypothetical protein [Opitutaceae bacterium]
MPRAKKSASPATRARHSTTGSAGFQPASDSAAPGAALLVVDLQSTLLGA